MGTGTPTTRLSKGKSLCTLKKFLSLVMAAFLELRMVEGNTGAAYKNKTRNTIAFVVKGMKIIKSRRGKTFLFSLGPYHNFILFFYG